MQLSGIIFQKLFHQKPLTFHSGGGSIIFVRRTCKKNLRKNEVISLGKTDCGCGCMSKETEDKKETSQGKLDQKEKK